MNNSLQLLFSYLTSTVFIAAFNHYGALQHKLIFLCVIQEYTSVESLSNVSCKYSVLWEEFHNIYTTFCKCYKKNLFLKHSKEKKEGFNAEKWGKKIVCSICAQIQRLKSTKDTKKLGLAAVLDFSMFQVSAAAPRGLWLRVSRNKKKEGSDILITDVTKRLLIQNNRPCPQETFCHVAVGKAQV